MWERLIELRAAPLALRPPLDVVPKDEGDAERIRTERGERYAPAVRERATIVNRRRRFYPEHVFDALMEVLKLAHTEGVELQAGYAW